MFMVGHTRENPTRLLAGKSARAQEMRLIGRRILSAANRQYPMAIRKEFFFLHVQHGNVYENKGALWKTGRRSWNVIENTGT